MTAHIIGDTSVLTGRSLRHILRSPDTILTTAVTPIALMLLFVYVLGGAIATGSGEPYIDYMLPGILLITIASGIAYTAYRLFLDLQGGIFERFQSMPIARSSVPLGARAERRSSRTSCRSRSWWASPCSWDSARGRRSERGSRSSGCSCCSHSP